MARASFWIIPLTGLLVAGIVVVVRELSPPLRGEALLALVVLYNVVVGIASRIGNQGELADAWAFLLPLSIGLMVPEAVMVKQLWTLAFVDIGGPRWFGVPLVMGGFWVAPLLVIVWLAEITHQRSAFLAFFVALIVSVVVLVGIEWAGHAMGFWLTKGGAATWHGMPKYVLPAEILLGVATWLFFVGVQGRTWFAKIGAAALVSMIYTGALVTSYLFFDRVL